jgi:hypothetical protein
MRQIGMRQEAARLGGIGSCGRELCCSTWLTDFRSVSTSAARYQQLSLNPQKLAGQCGKLKCCLNYELDMYLDAIKSFPKSDTKLQTENGNAYHVKTDVFKRQMWFAYEGNSAAGLISITPERVREIVKLNGEGKKPKELNEYVHEIEVKEPDYSNVVGQDSLNRFEHAFKSKKKKKKSGNRPADAAQVKDVQTNPNQNREKQAARPTNPKPQGAQTTPSAEGELVKPNPNKRRKNRPKKKPNSNPNASDGNKE